MSMPWDTPNNGNPNTPPPRYVPPPTPPQVPPAGQPYPPPGSPQQMRPDIPPVVARNPQTGETVRVDLSTDLREAIRQAITQSVVENKDAMIGNAQTAIAKAVQGQKPTVQAPVPAALAGTVAEDSFEMGPATKRTFVQGMAVDMGFAALAVLATVTSTDFNVADKEAWTVVGVMMLKTLIQTGMSYAMRLKIT